MNKRGFTLIELLVVISIIGILASMTFVSYTGAQKQTRDTERRSDLAQYRNGLASYAATNNGLYPNRDETSIGGAGLCSDLSPDFITSCPSDPSTFNYHYYSDGDGSGGASSIQYVLWVEMETGGYWEVCSDGRAGKYDPDPPADPTDENCDLL